MKLNLNVHVQGSRERAVAFFPMEAYFFIVGDFLKKASVCLDANC